MENLNSFDDLLSFCVTNYADQILFKYKHNQITYKCFIEDLYECCDAIFTGINVGTRVILIGDNSYEWILICFAIIRAKCIVIPVDPNLDVDSIKKILHNSLPLIIFCSDKYRNKIDEIILDDFISINIFSLDKLAHRPILKLSSIIEYEESSYTKDLNDFCLILYTSGTTGLMKGVCLSENNIISNAVAIANSVDFKHSTLLVLPLYHAFAFTANLISMMLMGRIIYLSEGLPFFYKELKQFSPSNLFIVPSLLDDMYRQLWKNTSIINRYAYKLLIKFSNFLLLHNCDVKKMLFGKLLEKIGNVHTIFVGGAPLQKDLVEKFADLGVTVLCGYGLTEFSPVVSVNRNCNKKLGSVGLPINGVHVKIVNGEIYVRGSSIMKGYYNDIENTKMVIVDNWLRTGDLGYIDDEGFIFIIGRCKNIIVLSNGKKVSPEELESYLYSLSYVKDAIVFEKNDRICAEISLYDEYINVYDYIQIENDVDKINKLLPLYKRISEIFINNNFEYNSINKVRRKRLDE